MCCGVKRSMRGPSALLWLRCAARSGPSAVAETRDRDARAHARGLAEERAEVRDVGEADLLADLSDPEGARADQAHRRGHLQTMPPILRGNTRRVDFAAADLEALTVEEEIIRADGEGVFRSAGFQTGALGSARRLSES